MQEGQSGNAHRVVKADLLRLHSDVKEALLSWVAGASEVISAFARSPVGYHPPACVELRDRVAVSELER